MNEVPNKIEIQMDDETKITVMANHGTWENSLKTNTPICFGLGMAKEKYEDNRMVSEITVAKLRDTAYRLLRVADELDAVDELINR